MSKQELNIGDTVTVHGKANEFWAVEKITPAGEHLAKHLKSRGYEPRTYLLKRVKSGKQRATWQLLCIRQSSSGIFVNNL